MPKDDVTARMAEVMAQRHAQGLATTGEDLKRLGFTEQQIETHGTSAVTRARRLAESRGLDLPPSAPLHVDPDPFCCGAF